MFSTVLNIFSWTLWTIKNSFLLFLLLCRLSWKLLLVLVFLDGFYKAIRFLHKVCNIIAEKSSQEKKKTSDLNVLLHQSSEDISVVSEMSSFNTNEEYVVESWNSYQVKLWSTEQSKQIIEMIFRIFPTRMEMRGREATSLPTRLADGCESGWE